MRRLIDRARRAVPWEGVRARIAPFVAAVALMVPFGSVVTSRAQLIADADPSVTGAVQAASDAGVRSPRRSGAAETGSADAVGRAWATAAVERERQQTATEFARRFGISVGLAKEIHGAAVREQIEPTVAFGLVRTESSFRRTVVSYAGAVGYTQLLPSTARWIAPGTARGDLFETRTNLRVGFRYLRYLLDKYDGDTRLALLAYNRGPGTVDGILRRGGNPDNGYADKVLRG